MSIEDKHDNVSDDEKMIIDNEDANVGSSSKNILSPSGTKGSLDKRDHPLYTQQPKPSIKSIRIHIPLSQDDPESNIFDYAALKRLHIERYVQSVRSESGHGGSTTASSSGTDSRMHVSETSVALKDVAEPDEDDVDQQQPNLSSVMPKKKKKKKHMVDEDEYDLDDDFIDDSEMFIEEIQEHLPPPRWHYGFFAWKGSVESFLEQKAKQKKKGQSGAGTSNRKKGSMGTSTAVIVGETLKPASQVNASLAGTNVGTGEKSNTTVSPKKKMTTTASNKSTTKASDSAPSKSSGSKSTPSASTTIPSNVTPTKANEPTSKSSPASIKSKKGELVPVGPTVAVHIARLKEAAAKESFAVKKNFPSTLKPILKDAAVAALDAFEHDSNFYAHITSVLPYNTFTMKKLVANLVHQEKITEYKAQSAKLIAELTSLVEEQIKAQGLLNVSQSEPLSATAAEQSEVTVKEDPANTKPKFRFNEECRAMIWNILCLEWEAAKLENELNHYNKKEGVPVLQEQAVRRAAYIKMIAAWPTGMMDASILSKEFSFIRHRMKKRNRASLEQSASGMIIRPDPFKPATYGQGATSNNNSTETAGSSTPKKGANSSSSSIIKPSPSKPKLSKSHSSTSLVSVPDSGSVSELSVASQSTMPTVKKRKQPPSQPPTPSTGSGAASEKKSKLDQPSS